MQLQMTAPLDIGLEQTDESLMMGQEDVFSLGEEERVRRRQDGMPDDEDSDDEDETLEDPEETLDSDEEAERKVQELEAEMDGMYDSYRERLRDRDAKYKVKEARAKNTEREEWGGVKRKPDSDEEDAVSEEEDGGWDIMDQAKARDDPSSDESDSDSEPKTTNLKRRRKGDATGPDTKRSRLITKLEAPKPTTSAASKVWFSQDVFAEVGDLDAISDDEMESEAESEGQDVNEDEDEEDIVMAEKKDSDVEDDGFDIVPLEPDMEDDDMWDVDDDNVDAAKAAIIKSQYCISS